MKIFLKYFTENIIEAVGGYKDFADRQSSLGLQRDWTSPTVEDSPISSVTTPSKAMMSLEINESSKEAIANNVKTPNEEFAEGEVFAFDNEEELSKGPKSVIEFEESKNDIIEVPSAIGLSADTLLDALANRDKIGKLSEGNISQVASESVIWLTHRLGPVLTAKYLSKNLLKMLNLCFIGPKSSLPSNEIKQDDFVIRIHSIYKTNGDILAHNVLECLKEIACIYGENFILVQFLPYAWDLISLC